MTQPSDSSGLNRPAVDGPAWGSLEKPDLGALNASQPPASQPSVGETVPGQAVPGQAVPGQALPGQAVPSNVGDISRTVGQIADAVGGAMVGNQPALRVALAAILAGGHVLIEDNPGLGKTLMARSLAGALGLEFRRLQFTPDLLPADITGSYLYNPGTTEFTFQPGPVFAGLLLADELNRTPPKTQSALLEAMQEGQVSVEGKTHPLPRPFHVIATANQIEYEGTYALPEAQLDRFAVRIRLGYPSAESEAVMLRRRIERASGDPVVAPVIDAAGLSALQEGVERISVDADIITYCVNLANASRSHESVEAGISPRGTQSLLLLARAWAVLSGRTFVLPEDVKDVAVAALGHRMVLKLQAYSDALTGEDVVRSLLASVPTPPSRRATMVEMADTQSPAW